jgi:peptidoglycan/xylan/chitin deacetylase (PgdA/CDA1 family)
VTETLVSMAMMKVLAKKTLTRIGILRVLARRRPNAVAILMYHSVMENPKLVVDSLGEIVHPTRVFDAQMQMLARDFHPISLDDLNKFVRSEAELPKRSVVVTFDDGYADNYEVAMPILTRVGVPASFYVTVDCVERKTLPWPSRLRFAFRTTQKRTWIDEKAISWALGFPQQRERAYLSACDQFCKLSGASLESRVSQTEIDLDAKISDATGNLMLDWDQARSLAKNGYIVGSHTMTHPNLAFLELEDVRRELNDSKRQMEDRMGMPIHHVSYPCPALFPNWTQQTTAESQRAGYKTAVTTTNGLAHERDNPLQLKRLGPTKTVDGLRWNLESAFAGWSG